ncbi:MAG: hypothetical protein QOH81_471 [Sphingomonadales bacterium]|jgi:ABC-type lipoprotein release transport system permease subunit|nr:hypothetical protein [Sphingomonadales bacterium]
MSLARRLVRVLGGRVFWSFALVTFLMAGLLATVNLASRYALKDYVDGQLARTPWDLTVFQVGGSDVDDPTVAGKIASVKGIARVETMAVLRAKLPKGTTETLVDGKQLQAPWLTLIAVTSPALLPPQLQAGRQDVAGAHAEHTKPILALVGPETAMGPAFLALQGAKQFSLQVKTSEAQTSVFTTPIEGVVRLDRDELTRWMMDQMGSQSYVPPVGAVLLMPYDRRALRNFNALAQGIMPPDIVAEQGADSTFAQGHGEKAEYIPEVIYLARLNRDQMISGWDVDRSLENVLGLRHGIIRALAEQPGGVPAAPRLRAASLASPEFAQLGPRRTTMASLVPAVAGFGGDGADGARPKLQLLHGSDDPEGLANDNPYVAISDHIVDSTTEVLLRQMNKMARLLGLVTLLVALPLLWMGWMLASNLAGLLMLNERRKLGLMRLRGVPGKQLGRALLMAVGAGGLAGGILGVVLGSVVPLLIYEGGRFPAAVLLQPQQLGMLLMFLLITVLLSLIISARLINYATTISPLEASGRFSSSEATVTSVRFGLVQGAALIAGAVALAGWVFGFSPTGFIPSETVRRFSVVLDFISLPLFLYGIISLLASRREWIQAMMSPIQRLIGGRLSLFTQRHMAAKPHRAVAFLMIVALMASISLYPTIASRSFQDKVARGAQVQLGSDWHYTFNSPELASGPALTGAVHTQLRQLTPAMKGMAAAVGKLEGVESAGYMVEAFMPGFYLPGYGMKGVPLYLLDDAHAYQSNSYAEPELGVGEPFRDVLQRVRDGGVAVSPSIAEFWNTRNGTPLRLGLDTAGGTIALPTAGTLGFLPGIPARSVTDRQGFVQARVDYLNYLFDHSAYAAVAASNPKVQNLVAFIPRTILLVKVDPAVSADPLRAAELQSRILKTFASPPLETHSLGNEIKKVGSDMFVSLALENMKIYLIGGIVLAVIAIFAVALANYAEDRRTLSLLRVRGSSPAQLRRFLIAMLLSPALVGLVLGGVTAMIAGYGLTNYVWKLRDMRSVVQLLRTHLLISGSTVLIAIFLMAVVIASAWVFGLWSFRKSARVLNS